MSPESHSSQVIATNWSVPTAQKPTPSVLVQVGRAHPLLFSIRISLGILLLPPVIIAFCLFCFVAICADKLARSR